MFPSTQAHNGALISLGKSAKPIGEDLPLVLNSVIDAGRGWLCSIGRSDAQSKKTTG